jgi:hypothetical protein
MSYNPYAERILSYYDSNDFTDYVSNNFDK